MKLPDGLFSTWRSGTIQSGKIDQEPGTKKQAGDLGKGVSGKSCFQKKLALDEKFPAGAEGIHQGHDAATRLFTEIGEEMLKVASTRVILEGR